MSISHWLSEDGRRAIERMGGVGWEDDMCVFRLAFDASGFPMIEHRHKEKCGTRGWHYLRRITPHEALCLLRDAARAWLETESDLFVTTGGQFGPLYILHSWNEPHDRLELSHHDDYDAALIAAALAVGEA